MRETDESVINAENANMVVGRNAVSELIKSGRDIDKIFLKDGEWEGSIKSIAAMAKERGPQARASWTSSRAVSLTRALSLSRLKRNTARSRRSSTTLARETKSRS